MNKTSLQIVICLVFILGLSSSQKLFAQAGLREALEKLDRNENGKIDPNEITSLARPYLERIARERKLSLKEPVSISKLQESARIYYALKNGASGRTVRPQADPLVKSFGPDDDEPLIPEFGLGTVKYPYTPDDLDEADDTLRRSDRNEDGYIDRREAQRAKWTHRNPFEMDLNNDNLLSRLELAQRYARRRLLSGAASELVKKAVRIGSGIEPSVKEDDSNSSSKSWRDSGNRYWLMASVLERFDSNRNGQLDASESKKLGVPTSRIDLDLDGILTKSELSLYYSELQDKVAERNDDLPEWFYDQDINQDQQISMNEFTEEWTEAKLIEFNTIDLNKDGLLTSSEIINSKTIVGGNYFSEKAEVIPPRKTVISKLEVSDDYLIGDVNLQLSITHSNVSYLDCFLTGPDGQVIELFTDIGGSGNHFDNTIFDDQARYWITKARTPYKGTFVPEGFLKKAPSLTSFNGINLKGTWTLTIRAQRNDRFGILHGWGLIIKPLDEVIDSEQSIETSSIESQLSKD